LNLKKIAAIASPVALALTILAVGGCAEPQISVSPTGPLEIVEKTVTEDGTIVAKLDNGLTVIVKAVRTAPVVFVGAYVRTGAMVEGKWLGSGISHLTEHLVAKGAVHDGGGGAKSAKQTTDRIAEIGGQSNASTSISRTRYFISAAAGKTNDCIDLVADWMARAEISREDFEREHGVVQRELELAKDNAARQLWRAHAENAFGSHPAAVPVLGYRKPLSELTYEEVLAYHSWKYVPQNMLFVVVGDVDAAAAIERVRHAFAGFARGRADDVTPPAVPVLSGVRRVVRPHKELTETMEAMSFQTIPLVHPDLYALDVLSYVLTRGRSSRLVRKIEREKKLVTTISSSSWTPAWGRGLFELSFRGDPNDADAAEAAIIAELKAVADKGVTAAQLARAKRQKTADFIYSQQTAQSIAGTLASDMLSTGDVGFSRDYTDRIQAVTAGQVKRAARKYFTFDRMAVTRLVPPGTFSLGVGAGKAAGKSDTTMFTMPNGLRVVLHPTKDVQLVSMTFAAAGGVLLETKNTNGLGTLMTALSTKGAGKRSADQIAAFFDRAGGSISGRCGNNSFYWRAKVLDDSFTGALEIFADVICRPTFSGKELSIYRPKLLQSIERADQDLIGQAFKINRAKFFTGSPYRWTTAGRKEVVSAATVEQIAAYHRKNLRAGSCVLAIFGNFDAPAARARIEKLFAPLADGKIKLPSPAARTVAAGGEFYIEKTAKTGAAVVVSLPGMKLDSPDRFAITVLDTIISGYHLPSGWLHSQLRGKRLVYVVHAYNWPGLAPGAFMTYAACQPEKAPQVVEIIKRNLARASRYRPTKKEVSLAVNTILTAEILQNQSMSALAMSAALDELYGYGYDFRGKLERHYRRVTPEQVLQVGRKHLSGGAVVIVTTPKPEAFDTP